MSEQDSGEQQGINCDQEYIERFARAKSEAEAKGLRYEYPNSAGVGWKIHLNVSPNKEDTLTGEVSSFLNSNRVKFKVGRSGGQEGKGMTIYIGDRDTMEDLAQELFDTYGERIPQATGETLTDDMAVVGMIRARFENTSDYTRNPGGQKYAQYGFAGIPYLWIDYHNNQWPTSEGKLSRGQKINNSVTALANDYGTFFTGTRNHPIHIGQQNWVKEAVERGRRP